MTPPVHQGAERVVGDRAGGAGEEQAGEEGTDEQIKSWAHAVLHQLQVFADLGRDNFIFLAGERYRRHLIPRIRHFQIPMLGLTIGKQLQYLKQSIGHEQHM